MKKPVCRIIAARTNACTRISVRYIFVRKPTCCEGHLRPDSKKNDLVTQTAFQQPDLLGSHTHKESCKSQNPTRMQLSLSHTSCNCIRNCPWAVVVSCMQRCIAHWPAPASLTPPAARPPCPEIQSSSAAQTEVWLRVPQRPQLLWNQAQEAQRAIP